jgi:hypothetical protein
MYALTRGAYHRKPYDSDQRPSLIASDTSCHFVDRFSLLFVVGAIPRLIGVPEPKSFFGGYTPQTLYRSLSCAISRP